MGRKMVLVQIIVDLMDFVADKDLHGTTVGVMERLEARTVMNVLIL